MKKKSIILVALFFIHLSSQGQHLFSVCLNYCNGLPNVPQMNGIKIIEAADGNGSISLIEPIAYSQLGFFLTRIDSIGNQLWNHVLKIDSNDIHIINVNDTFISRQLYPIDIINVNSNGYLICATEDSLVNVIDTSGNQSFFSTSFTNISRIDTAGNVLWSKKMDITNLPIKTIFTQSDNFIYVLAKQSSLLYLIKMDTSGNVIWIREYNGFAGNIDGSDFAFSSSFFYVALNVNQDIILIKTDTSGNVSWSKKYDSGNNDELISIVAKSNGCAIGLNKDTAPHPVITLIDSSGNLGNSSSFISDTSFYMHHFIPYGADKFLMIQRSDTALPNHLNVSGRFSRVDLWIINSANNSEVHNNIFSHSYNYGLHDIGAFTVKDVIKNTAGLLKIVDIQAYFYPFSLTQTLPTILQSDSVGKGACLNTTVITNHTISNEVMISSNINVLNSSVSVGSQSVNVISYDSLLFSNTSCLGYVGIEDLLSSAPAMILYPNPNTGRFVLKTTNQPFNKSIITILNSYGDIIFKSEILNPKSEIDISSYPAGIYFLKVNEGNKMEVKKIVKM